MLNYLTKSMILALGIPLSTLPALAQEKTIVTWWEASDESSGLNDAVRQGIQDAFNASQDEIELQIIFKTGDYESLTRTALLAGTGPDIVTTPGPSGVQAYQSGGLLVSLDEYSEQYGWQDMILPWAYNAGVLEGEFYAFPKNYESMVYFYNKTLFEENGWSLPTNLAEYESLAESIQAAGIYPFAYGSAGWPRTHEHLVGNYLNTVAGPDSVYLAMIGEKSWADPEFVQSIELLNKHMQQGYWSGGLESYYAVGWDDFFAQFSSRDAAMLQIGTWGFSGTVEAFANSSDEWGWAPLPILTEEGGQPNYQLAVGGTMSINSASENPDAAAEVLNWLVNDKKRALEFTAGRSYGEWLLPLRYEASDFSHDIDHRIRDYLVDFAETTGRGDYGYTTWTYYPSEAGTHIWKDMEVVWAGEITPLEFLEEQQELWDEAREDNAIVPIGDR